MSKQRAAKWQGTGWVNVEEGATRGATLGVDVFGPDGSVLTLAQLIALAAGAATATPAGSVPWRSLIDVPANVLQVVDLATNGLVVRRTDGSWVTRTVEAVAGETTSAEEDGEGGNPTIGLADVADSGTGSLRAFNRDGKGRVTGYRAATQADIDTALGYEAVESVQPGTNVTVDATDPRNPIVNATGGSDREYPPVEAWASGLMRHPFAGTQINTRISLAIVQDRLYMMPGYVTENIDVSNPKVNVAVGVASGTVRVGICEWDPVNNEPGAMVVDWGTASSATSNTFPTFSNGAAVASLLKGGCYALLFICGGAASAASFYYIPFSPLGIPVMNEGTTIQSIAAYIDAAEGAQRTGGFNSPPSTAAAMTTDTAVNITGMRAMVYFATIVPTP